MAKIINKKEKGTNRHWKNFIDKNYLGSHNLEPGEELLVTIERFEGEEEVKDAKGGKSSKQVLYFKENVPKMIMNITNGTTIEMLYGKHPVDWIGKKIQIYSTSVPFGKKQVDALRIRDFIPRTEADGSKYMALVEAAKTLEELKDVWSKIPESVRKLDKKLIALKDEVKNKLQVK